MKSLINSLLSVAVITLVGCGGGGGGGGTPAPPAGSVTVGGVATDGPISGADISVFPIKADGTGPDRTKLLVAGKTQADGSYSVTIPPALAPSGPVVVEISGGTYTDDLSGTPNLPLRATLHAVVTSVANGDHVTVTPLTELAYKKAEGTGSFSPANIDDANLKIGQTFGVDNIIRARPFNATQAAPTTATADDKKYAAALGVFEQMVTTSKGSQTLDNAMKTLLDAMSTEVHDDGGFSVSTINTYNTAITTFTSKNTGGTLPSAIVFKAGVLTLSTSGTLASGTAINGIDVTITLPAGVTVKADGITGEIAGGSLSATGVAGTNSLISGKYTPAAGGSAGTVRIVIANVQPGFVIGEFARLNFDGFPAVGASFAASGTQVSGGSDPKASPAPLAGVTVTSSFSGL